MKTAKIIILAIMFTSVCFSMKITYEWSFFYVYSYNRNDNIKILNSLEKWQIDMIKISTENGGYGSIIFFPVRAITNK